ncbi:hypothetical protein AK812_SmicGene36797 [Symbiodinium microadriaticum]|uniref:Uncharacterized protein n=1 Tax=Symbiodinium microadriaticum TaxID=2951 RepID=A0A1Q9CHY5_SYMMI|nr:hypothetical protein AK812_SmicGene36797 [Symbiodinium microadriaticum]
MHSKQSWHVLQLHEVVLMAARSFRKPNTKAHAIYHPPAAPASDGVVADRGAVAAGFAVAEPMPEATLLNLTNSQRLATGRNDRPGRPNFLTFVFALGRAEAEDGAVVLPVGFELPEDCSVYTAPYSDVFGSGALGVSVRARGSAPWSAALAKACQDLLFLIVMKTMIIIIISIFIPILLIIHTKFKVTHLAHADAMASSRIFPLISLLGLAGARRAPEGAEAALGCLAGIFPKEAWPQLRSYADAAALLEKSCRSLGHDSETCADSARAVLRRPWAASPGSFPKRPLGVGFEDAAALLEKSCRSLGHDSETCADSARAVFARFGAGMSAPVAADEQLCSDVLAAFTTIISTASICDFGPDDESDAPPKEALEWCPELLQWLHREKQYGPEGYHVICLDPSQKGAKRNGWLFANASAASAREIAAPRPWASLRKSFQPWLRPSSRWELHPWQLFNTEGRPAFAPDDKFCSQE